MNFGPTPRHILIKLSKVETRRESSKQQRKTACYVLRNPQRTVRRFPKGLSADFSAGASWPEGVAQCIPRAKRKNVPTKNTLPGSAVGQTEGSRKAEAGVQHQKAALQSMLERRFKADKKDAD